METEMQDKTADQKDSEANLRDVTEIGNDVEVASDNTSALYPFVVAGAVGGKDIQMKNQPGHYRDASAAKYSDNIIDSEHYDNPNHINAIAPGEKPNFDVSYARTAMGVAALDAIYDQ